MVLGLQSCLTHHNPLAESSAADDRSADRPSDDWGGPIGGGSREHCLLESRRVRVLRHGKCIRLLDFAHDHDERDVALHAVVGEFADSANQRVVVVAFERVCHVVYLDGPRYLVALPYPPLALFAVPRGGFVVETGVASVGGGPAARHFLTLTHPLRRLGSLEFAVPDAVDRLAYFSLFGNVQICVTKSFERKSVSVWRLQYDADIDEALVDDKFAPPAPFPRDTSRDSTPVPMDVESGNNTLSYQHRARSLSSTAAAGAGAATGDVKRRTSAGLGVAATSEGPVVTPASDGNVWMEGGQDETVSHRGFVVEARGLHMEEFFLNDVEDIDVFVAGNHLVYAIGVFCPHEQSLSFLSFRFTKEREIYLADAAVLSARAVCSLRMGESLRICILLKNGKLALEEPMAPRLSVGGSNSRFTSLEQLAPDLVRLMPEPSLGSNKPLYLSTTIVNEGHPLVDRCLAALCSVLSEQSYRIVNSCYQYKVLHCSSATEARASHLECFLTVVFASYLYNSDNAVPEPSERFLTPSSPGYLLPILFNAHELCELTSFEPVRQELAAMLLTLHLVSEDLKLDSRYAHWNDWLVPALAQLSIWMEWPGFLSAYRLYNARIGALVLDSDRIKGVNFPAPAWMPPSIYDWLAARADEATTSKKSSSFFPALANVFREPPYLVQRADSPVQDAIACERLSMIRQIYGIVLNPHGSLHSLITQLSQIPKISEFIQHLPKGIDIPLLQVLTWAKDAAQSTWTLDELHLAGRQDLIALYESATLRIEPNYSDTTTASRHLDMSDLIKSATAYSRSIVPGAGINGTVIRSTNADAETPESSSGHNSGHSEASEIHYEIFRHDRRLDEAFKCLAYYQPPSVRQVFPESLPEHELVTQQRRLAFLTVERTMACPLGYGAFRYSTRQPSVLEQVRAPAVSLSVRVLPSKTVVTIDKTQIDETALNWADFHAGVASGLQIDPSSADVTSSWIVYNRDTSHPARHAGFLLGIGLNGHLKVMATWTAFNYLVTKNSLTSKGVLLGIAASFRGTMDQMVTRLLSVHVLALLPPASTDLNLSPSTQSAGLVGIGLLYMASGHRRMSEVTLEEMFHRREQIHDFVTRQLYQLSNAFALGLINLGLGDSTKGLGDLHISRRLLSMLASNSGNSTSSGKNTTMAHEVVSAEACLAALGLMFLQTNNTDIAAKLDLSRNFHLDFHPPTVVLLRVLVRACIMWDEVRADRAWIQSQVPLYDLDHLFSRHQPSIQHLSVYNAVCGGCFALGLRYAGTGNIAARDLLLEFWQALFDLAQQSGAHEPRHHEKVCAKSLVRASSLVAMAAALVMAGTGDLAVFRRLRHMTANNPTTTAKFRYGEYMVCSMAIGFLFLGEGRLSFSRSKEAIAGLFISLYPIFPSTSTTNCFYLEPLRHLWALATEPRLLLARDYRTHQVLRVPVIMVPKDAERRPILRLESPCWHPPLDEYATIRFEGEQHWPLEIDASAYRRLQTVGTVHGVVCIDRKQAPRGAEETGTDMLRDAVDAKTVEASKAVMQQAISSVSQRDQLVMVRFVMAFYDSLSQRYPKESADEQLHLVSREFLDSLRLRIWRKKHRY